MWRIPKDQSPTTREIAEFRRDVPQSAWDDILSPTRQRAWYEEFKYAQTRYAFQKLLTEEEKRQLTKQSKHAWLKKYSPTALGAVSYKDKFKRRIFLNYSSFQQLRAKHENNSELLTDTLPDLDWASARLGISTSEFQKRWLYRFKIRRTNYSDVKIYDSLTKEVYDLGNYYALCANHLYSSEIPELPIQSDATAPKDSELVKEAAPNKLEDNSNTSKTEEDNSEGWQLTWPTTFWGWFGLIFALVVLLGLGGGAGGGGGGSGNDIGGSSTDPLKDMYDRHANHFSEHQGIDPYENPNPH